MLARFAFACPLVRRPAGAGFAPGTLAHGATVHRLAIDRRFESQQFVLEIAALDPMPVRYRGVTWQAGRHLGFAVATASGSLWLLSETAPAIAATIAIAGVADGYFGCLGGTPIETPHGQQAVETLSPGARLRCADGAVETIRGVARIAVSDLFADELRALPIRIGAGALGGGLPAADMLVSPDLALLLDGCLIQAGALVNAQTVRREAAWPDAYWRLRLTRHGLARIQGVAVETIRVPPEEAEMAEEDAIEPAPADYPRATSHRQVPYAIRARLAEEGKARPGAPPLDPAGAKPQTFRNWSSKS